MFIFPRLLQETSQPFRRIILAASALNIQQVSHQEGLNRVRIDWSEETRNSKAYQSDHYQNKGSIFDSLVFLYAWYDYFYYEDSQSCNS